MLFINNINKTKLINLISKMEEHISEFVSFFNYILNDNDINPEDFNDNISSYGSRFNNHNKFEIIDIMCKLIENMGLHCIYKINPDIRIGVINRLENDQIYISPYSFDDWKNRNTSESIRST